LKLKHQLKVINFPWRAFLPQMNFATVFLFVAAKWSKDKFRKIQLNIKLCIRSVTA